MEDKDPIENLLNNNKLNVKLSNKLNSKMNDSTAEDVNRQSGQIERLNRFVKLNRNNELKCNQTNFFDYRENDFQTDDYDTISDRILSWFRSYFYRYILFGCLNVKLPSDD